MSERQQGPGRPRSATRSQSLPITSHGQPEQLLGLARLLLRMHRGPALRVVAGVSLQQQDAIPSTDRMTEGEPAL